MLEWQDVRLPGPDVYCTFWFLCTALCAPTATQPPFCTTVGDVGKGGIKWH